MTAADTLLLLFRRGSRRIRETGAIIYPFLAFAIPLTVATLLPARSSAADFTAEQVHNWWVAEIDDVHRADGAGILPYPNTDVTRKMSHIILDGLWDSQDYRNALTTWLATPHAEIANDAVAQWRSHVQIELTDSMVRFMSDDTVRALLQLKPEYVIGHLPQEVCHGQTFASLHALEASEQKKVLDTSGEQLAGEILGALKRDYALQDSPGGKPVRPITNVTMQTYGNILSSLPRSDAPRVAANFASYTADTLPRAPVFCLSGWLASHAILDSYVENPPAHLSATEMRANMAKGAYQEMLHIYSSGIKVPIPGFKPRHDLNLSELLTKGGLSGTAYVVFNIDVAGHIGAVALESSNLQPESVTALDGTSYKTADLVESAASDYLKAGVFDSEALENSAQDRRMRLPLSF